MNSDAGYYLFHCINKRTFYIEHHRFVLGIAEILPLIFTWLGLPLKSIIIAYSIGHVIFFALSSMMAYRFNPNSVIPLLIALLGIAGLRESVYTPQFELYYGLVFVFLAYSLILKNNFRSVELILFTVFLFFAFTSHPFAVVGFLFVFVLHIANFRTINFPLILSVVLLLIVYIFWKNYTASGYEQGKISLYSTAIKELKFFIPFTHGKIPGLLKQLFLYYPDIIALMLFAFTVLIINRKYILSSLAVLMISVALLLIWMLYPEPGGINRYLEQVYFIFVFAVLSLFLFLELNPRYLYVFFAVFLYRVVIITNLYSRFQTRTEVMDKLLNIAAQRNGQRYYIRQKDMGLEQYDLADWSYGFETMCRSSVMHKKTISIVTEDDLFFEKNDSLLSPDQYLFRRWEREYTSDLNAVYFKMEPGVYQLLVPEKN